MLPNIGGYIVAELFGDRGLAGGKGQHGTYSSGVSAGLLHTQGISVTDAATFSSEDSIS
jgi:hypothetical protein